MKRFTVTAVLLVATLLGANLGPVTPQSVLGGGLPRCCV